MFQYKSDSPQLKQNLISIETNLLYELFHQLSNSLRLKILKNQKILEKFQICVEPNLAKWLRTKWLWVRIPLQSHNIVPNQQQSKCTQKQISKFSSLVLFSSTGFLNFVQSILPKIHSANNFLVKTWQSPANFQNSLLHFFDNDLSFSHL